MNNDTELQRLLQLHQAGRNHPDHLLYVGLAAWDHEAILAALASDRTRAKRIHRECLALGVISPAVATSRDGVAMRVQFIYPEVIADVLSGGRRDE
jgi:hypothetical protein